MENFYKYLEVIIENITFFSLKILLILNNFINFTKTFFLNSLDLLTNIPFYEKIPDRIKIEFFDFATIIISFYNLLGNIAKIVLPSILITIILILIVSFFQKINTKNKLPITRKQNIKKNFNTNLTSNKPAREKLLEIEIKLLEIQHQYVKGKISLEDYRKNSINIGKSII